MLKISSNNMVKKNLIKFNSKIKKDYNSLRNQVGKAG